MPLNRPRQVALIIETSASYGRRILNGVARYLRSHHQWSVFLEQHALNAPPPSWMASGKWDGILCRSTDPALARRYLRMGVPVIDLNDRHDGLGLPWVGSDQEAMGRMGVSHFIERGFRHFAFCGFSGELWSERRRDSFTAGIEKQGYRVSVHESPWHGVTAPRWDLEIDRIGQWLKRLPKPLAVMGCNDVRGLHLLDACRRIRALVPEEIAVLGVGDEEVLCALSNPPLSSVAPDAERVGYEAAGLLDTLMSGGSRTPTRSRIAPLGVVTRQSSDVVAVEDRHVAAAARYIREKAAVGCCVEDVLKHVGISRSLLERRFRKYLHRSPQEEIRALQLNRVKQLLAETDFTLERIAGLSGFEHPEYMSVVFKRLTGQTPGGFRRQYGKDHHVATSANRPYNLEVRHSRNGKK